MTRAPGRLRLGWPRPGDAGHQGMVHALMVVAVPGRTGLMAVDLDGQAVHVDGQISLPVTAAHPPEPPPRELGDRLMEHSAVRRRAQKRDQARQRGLRSRRSAAGTLSVSRLVISQK